MRTGKLLILRLIVLLGSTRVRGFRGSRGFSFRRVGSTMAASSSPAATHVLFDIDGTLADSFELGFSATQEVLVKEGLEPITHEDYHAHTIYPTPERLARHAFGLQRPAGTISDGAAEALSLGLVASREEFLDRGARLGGAFDELYIGLVSTDTARFYDGVLPMLQRLRAKGVPLGALTNAAVAYAEAVRFWSGGLFSSQSLEASILAWLALCLSLPLPLP